MIAFTLCFLLPIPGGKAIYRGFQKFVKLLKEQYEVFLEVNTHPQ